MVVHIICACALVASGFIYRLKVTIGGAWMSGTWRPGFWPAAIVAILAGWSLSSLITPETWPAVLVGAALLCSCGPLWPLKRYVWLIKGFKGGDFRYGRVVAIFSFVLGISLLSHGGGF